MATYGIGKGTVLRLLRRSGAVIRPQPFTDDQIQVVIRLYRQGQSCVTIGKQIDRESKPDLAHPQKSRRTPDDTRTAHNDSSTPISALAQSVEVGASSSRL
jgi:hypothetical protein